MLNINGVELEFEPEALTAIAKRAVERKVGARGLRAIMEGILLELMYEIPDMKDVTEVIITDKVINGEGEAILVRSTDSKTA